MTILKSEEISCNHCVARITKALNEAKIPNEVSLEKKTVCIDGDEAVVSQAVGILDDLGFSAVVQ
jgi:copper chaperone CopZ